MHRRGIESDSKVKTMDAASYLSVRNSCSCRSVSCNKWKKILLLVLTDIMRHTYILCCATDTVMSCYPLHYCTVRLCWEITALWYSAEYTNDMIDRSINLLHDVTWCGALSKLSWCSQPAQLLRLGLWFYYYSFSSHDNLSIFILHLNNVILI